MQPSTSLWTIHLTHILATYNTICYMCWRLANFILTMDSETVSLCFCTPVEVFLFFQHSSTAAFAQNTQIYTVLLLSVHQCHHTHVLNKTRKTSGDQLSDLTLYWTVFVISFLNTLWSGPQLAIIIRTYNNSGLFISIHCGAIYLYPYCLKD